MRVIGVDGCPGGWIAMVYDLPGNTLTPQVHLTIAGLVDAYPDAAAIGVDIPIGFAEGCSGRLPDVPPTDAYGLRMEIVY